jgi:hypothetical protein
MRLLLVLPLLGLLCACARGERLACPEQDVGEIGIDEGTRGLVASLPKPDCVLDVSETTRYQQGRDHGLRLYCQAQRGYQLGLDGQAINPQLCDEKFAKELQRGFAVGDGLRQHLRQRDELLSQASDAERLAARLPADSPERHSIDQQAADARFEARQHDNEVEALRGIVAIEKWR